MKVHELKNWLISLPASLDNFDIVYSDVFKLSSGNIARKDSPVESVTVDQDTEEMILGKTESLDLFEEI